jgi:lysophospholipase L1-like esterase
MHCDDPCRSYVAVYGELASKALGRPVSVTNLATNDGLQSDQLLARVRTDPTHRAALADADLITLTIGNNDWEGPCYWDGHASCLEHGRTTVERNLGLILDEMATLRGTKPAAIRVTTQYDTWVGNPSTAGDWGFGGSAADLAAFHAAFKRALIDYNATVCRVAIAHGALCIDIAPPFNGPDLDRDAGSLLGGDHAHPSAAGHELIAATIASAGYAPLQ